MASRHFRILAVAALSGSLLGLVGCADSSNGDPETMAMGQGVVAEAERPANPMAGAPVNGACYRLSRLDLASQIVDAKPVDCTTRHNTMTIHVGVFPAQLEEPEDAYARSVCTREMPDALGIPAATVASTIFTTRWFEPNAEQREAGARWFRCDLYAATDAGSKRMPTSRAPLFNGTPSDSYVRCVRSAGSDESQARYVTCDQPHDYRYAGEFTVTETAKYPGPSRIRDWADERCRSFMPGTSPQWYTYPGRAAWRKGQRTVVCYRQVS